MSIDAQKLRQVMNEYSGGSDQRYRHMFNRRFIYTEGVKAVATAAGAYWMIDKVAFEMAPLYASAWLAGNASIGIVKLEVPKPGEGKPTLSLSLQDDIPSAFHEELPSTNFPEGEWVFCLGTDEIAPESYVTTMYLLQEH